MASFVTYVVIVVAFYLSSVPSLSCPQYQKEALLEFKGLVLRELYPNQYFNSSPLVLPSWNSSSSCCEWDHVLCYEHVVIELLISALFSTAVSTKILAPLSRVSTLSWLFIAGNHIHGPIPSSGFGNLTNLIYLDISSNDLYGSIPGDLFGQLRSLEHIDLSWNKLVGELPRNIGEAINVKHLALSNNYFCCTLPESFSNLSSLYYLDLSRNHLSGTISPILRPNSSLGCLDLSSNRFSGPIVPSLFGPNITELYFFQNEFSHVMSPALNLGNLSLLESFDIHDNRIIGGFPAFLHQCPSLRKLDLSNNHLVGSIPSLVGNADEFINLEVIKLSGNNFSGPLPEWLSNVTNLLVLDLSSNNLSGNIFPVGRNTFKAQKLDHSYVTVHSERIAIDLSYNTFFGPLPEALATNVRILSVAHNQLSGSLPTSLGKHNGLTLLDLHDNNIIGEIPVSLCQCSSLEVLDLSNNFVQGSIPCHISNLTSLRILDLSNNNLSGEIPPGIRPASWIIQKGVTQNRPLVEVGDYSSDCFTTPLCEIGRHTNDISSYLRDLIVNWKRSKHYLAVEDFNLYSILDLSKNQLSGPVPAFLGDLTGLKSLNLIPNSFGNLESLEVLDLSHNALSGAIPWTLAKLQQLNTIDLSNNQLVGRIPDSPQLDRLNDPKFYANNSGICGLQIQVPCSAQSPPRVKSKAPEESESKDAIFSWEIAVIVFPISFVGTVAIMYCSGYFHPVGKTTKSALRMRRKRCTTTTPAQGI